MTIDYIGLALDLESRAKTVESQTTERAMTAAANALRTAAARSPATVAQPVGWVAFADRAPPESAAKDDANVRATDRVLVTNNIKARDRMGRMSHVWFAAPIKDGKEWSAYDEGEREIERLTHWFDPFAAQPCHSQGCGGEGSEETMYALRWCAAALQALVVSRGESGSISMIVSGEKKSLEDVLDLADAALSDDKSADTKGGTPGGGAHE